MATVNIYDETTGRTYTITVDVNQAVINGLANGDEAYYISVSTSARDPLGQAIRTRIITDTDINSGADIDVTTPVNDAITEIMREIEGGYLSSSSSDSSLSSQSDSSLSTASSPSSVSSLSTASSPSSVSSLSTASSPSSVSSLSTASSPSSTRSTVP